MKRFSVMLLAGAATLAATAATAPQPSALGPRLCAPHASRADQEGIHEQPEGRLETVRRTTTRIHTIWGVPTIERVTIPAQVVWADNGDIFFKNYIFPTIEDEGTMPTWLKAHRDGSVVTMELPQICETFTIEGMTYDFPAYAVEDTYTNTDTPGMGEISENQTITYSYADGVITQTDGQLVGECQEGLRGGMEFFGQAVGYDVFEPITEQCAAIPQGAETERMALASGLQGQFVDVALDNGKVYIMLPGIQGAIVGSIEGEQAVFDKAQYLGATEKAFMYFMPARLGADGTIEFTDRLSLSYDSAGRTFASADGQGFAINDGKDVASPLASYFTLRLFPQANMGDNPRPMAPQNFVKTDLKEKYWESLGYCYMQFLLPNLTVEGRVIDKEDLYYTVYTDEDYPMTFYPDEYPGLPEATELLPAGVAYTDLYLDGELGHIVYIKSTGFERIGVAGVYKDAMGKLHPSEIVYSDGSVGVGETTQLDTAPAEYYDLMGRRVANPTHGIYVKVANGKTSKIAL